MQATNPRQAAPRSAGPFVTSSGRRLPVRLLAQPDIPALVEFQDYLARRSQPLQLLGQSKVERDRIQALTADVFKTSPVIGIMCGPRALVRGLGQYTPTSETLAAAQFTIDDSLALDEVERELLYRVADAARGAGIDTLQVVAPPGSRLRAAIAASGFPVKEGPEADHFAIAISEPL
jgi:hypothetical protein